MAEPARPFPWITPEEYLERECDASMKHEYVDGVVYKMAGTSRHHNTIALRAHGLLGGRLAKPSEPFALDIKVEVKAADKLHFFYPDVLVTSSELDSDPNIVRQPRLLIEVTSDSTRDYDRNGKFEKYRLLPSLQQYQLVEPGEQHVELFRKRTNWNTEIYVPPDEVLLESVQLSLPVSAFY